jgi:acetyl-CoA C-acetyltransferase
VLTLKYYETMSGLKDVPIPVIVGIAQYTHRLNSSDKDLHPLKIMSLVAKRAREDAGLLTLSEVDTLYVVNILSHQYANPPSMLAELLGIYPKETGYTGIGACAPQWFVHQAGRRIVNREAELVLICGAEAFHARSKVLDLRQDLAKASTSRIVKMVGDLRQPSSEMELRYDLNLPVNIYPLFENALRAAKGISISKHRPKIADFCARMSEIAAKNPYSWFQQPRTADEICTVSDENRMIAFPYSKFMCSIMNVDQGAAVLMTSTQKAKSLGIPKDKFVYLRGCADASDIWFVSRRPRFYESPSVHVAVKEALKQASVSLDEISYFDFYSCFPCAPRITQRMLNLPEDDPRPLTVNGGMPYFGGPGNNYSLHAICRMVEILRQKPDSLGMVQALSWYISKHSVGIYSGTSGDRPWIPVDSESYQRELDLIVGPEVVAEAKGEAYVETYTVIYDRQGFPAQGIIIGRQEDGRRFIAHSEQDQDTLKLMTEEELIGTRGTAVHQEATGLNLFKF